MEFEWDDAKNEANLAKHGIAFEEAIVIFNGITLTEIDSRREYGEVREIDIGLVADSVIIVTVSTDRNGVRRMISARRANRKERERYDEYCQKIVG